MTGVTNPIDNTTKIMLMKMAKTLLPHEMKTQLTLECSNNTSDLGIVMNATTGYATYILKILGF